MIKVNLSTLVHASAGRQISIILDQDNLSISDLDLRNLRGELRFTRMTHGIFVEGDLDVDVQVECTRCLSTFFTPIAIELEDDISLPGSDLTPERPVRVSEDGWTDLAPLIREYAWVNLPVNPICSPECKGICPECGGNLNQGTCVCRTEESIDPRWEALRTLLDTSSDD